MTVAGCDVSATGVVVDSKTSGGPRGCPTALAIIMHHIPSCRPWRHGASPEAEAHHAAQAAKAPRWLLCLCQTCNSLPSDSTSWGARGRRTEAIQWTCLRKEREEKAWNQGTGFAKPFHFLGWSWSWSQDDIYLDLVGSPDSIAAASESEPSIVIAQDKVDENEEKRGTTASDPLNTYLQVWTCLEVDHKLFQVGDWIAQWDAPYEAWYFYNSNTGTQSGTDPKAKIVI